MPRWIGIPTCAGIGATKTLARLASHLTKSLPRLLGVCDPSSLDREDTPAPRQQIMSTRSFGLPVRELAELEQAAGLFTSRAAEKPRQRHSHAAAVQVFIRASHFSTGPWHADSAVMPLSSPTDSTSVLLRAALSGLRSARAIVVVGGLWWIS